MCKKKTSSALAVPEAKELILSKARAELNYQEEWPQPAKFVEKSPKQTCFGDLFISAGGGTRTHTVLLPTDFESVTSTIPSHRQLT